MIHITRLCKGSKRKRKMLTNCLWANTCFERRDLATEETMGKARQRQLQRYVDHQTNSSPARKNRWNLAHLENMYVEGKCARDVTRKEEAVVKEASEPSSQSGISRYKLGKVVSSAIGRFLEV